MTAEEADELKTLQEDIYREKILRARAMTAEQRLNDVLELTNGVFARMLEGAMWQRGIQDPEEGWKEVARRLDRLSAMREKGRYVTQKPEVHDH